MIQQTGKTYTSGLYTKDLFVAGAKDGKTTFLLGQILGVWPGCNNGGIIDKPANLHIITADTAALRGARSFLQKKCNAPDEAFDYTVYNMEDDARRVAQTEADWDYTFYSSLLEAVDRFNNAAAKGGVHVLLVSSLTGVASALQRALFGMPGLDGKKGMGGDRAKWPAFASQINEVRSKAQTDPGHCFWEGHLEKKAAFEGDEKDSINVMGSAGKNFAFNVEHVYRIRRIVGDKYQSAPEVDKVYLDTQPSLTFMNNGREFSELKPREWDLCHVLKQLNYKVGGWKPSTKSVST